MKKKISAIILILVVILNPLIAKATTLDGGETIRNPDRGFYKLVQRELKREKEDFEDFEDEIMDIFQKDEDVSTISFQLNLKNYVKNSNISNNKVEEINEYFDIMRKYGYKVIYRVVYDSEGKENPEPEFEVLLDQIESLKETYVKNRDIILVVEAGYLGAYGEWHDGKYDTNKSYRNKIIDKLLQVVPIEIQINLRKPEFIIDYIGNSETVNSENAFSSEKIARLGLHNDGYLASETDLGTFEKEERTQSLYWQSKQTKFTIFGGESQKKDSKYNDLKNAIKDMKNRHCTYLNKTYDREVKEKWKNTIYQGNDEIYKGESGYKYIQDHLGYRLLLEEVNINETNEKLCISLVLENKGFGNIVKEKKLKIVCKNGEEIFELESDIDIRKFENDGLYSFKMELEKPPNMKNETYDIYLKIQDSYESIANNPYYQVKLANKNIWDNQINANYLGKAEIQNNNDNTSGIYKFLICFAIILITTFLVKKLSEGRKKIKMKLKKIIKKEKAITLIALVITIIVLLILAGISINAIIGNNGMFSRTEIARTETEKATAKEKISLEVLASYDDIGNFDIERLKTNLKNNLGLTDDDITDNADGSVTARLDGYEINIEANGNVEYAQQKEEINKKSFITEWSVSDNDTIVLPISFEYRGDNNFIVDWGDGSDPEEVNDEEEALTERPKHLYEKAGLYHISITGKCNYFTLSSIYDEFPDQVAKLTKIVSWGEIQAVNYDFSNGVGITGKIPSPSEKTFANVSEDGFNYLFYNCSNIEEIPEDLFANIPNNIEGFKSTFEGCKKLKFIPKNLFKNALSAKEFYRTFGYCNALKEIPEGLFYNNINATSFNSTFYKSENIEKIPLNLFDNNTLAYDFSNTFYKLIKITNGPMLWERTTEGLVGTSCYGECESFNTTDVPEEILNVWFINH